MNGVHDMGGLHCFGPVNPDPDESLFHSPWEKQVLALTIAMGATGTWNLDESRFMRESLPPQVYLSVGYYRIWLYALESLLLKHQLVTQQELNDGTVTAPAVKLKRRLMADEVAATLTKGSSVDRPTETHARFNVGDSVRVVNRHTPNHTRLPGYVRGRRGTIQVVHGCHVYPDSNALGLGENPQWLYNVSFLAGELWGDRDTQLDSVRVDCWEPYLEST